MSDRFFDQPILNSPYQVPQWHHPFDDDGQPTGGEPLPGRRRADLFTPVPSARKQRGGRGDQQAFLYQDDRDLSSAEQEYNPTPIINEIRQHVDAWRELPNPDQWKVTPTTARLLQHWRSADFHGFRPFFCQREAVETIIWLTEVAPASTKLGRRFWTYLENANLEANPDLVRLAMKMATGTGKTTVMAMLIAWQTLNAVRQPGSRKYTRGFLVVTPGITIRDRLRVLDPAADDNLYTARELVPPELRGDMGKAKVVVTNYHAFQRRERMEMSKTGRAVLQGHDPEPIDTRETEGEMLQRACGDLMGLRDIVVINDEAHHCWRERPDSDPERGLKGEDRDEARKNSQAARLWITGVETVQRHMGVRAVYDLSATPFFLRGSGYAEGTLFPWTVSDFSLLDAIESGIVKLPRIPVSDNIPTNKVPTYRYLWDSIGGKMPKKGRSKTSATLDPLSLPAELQTALDALYGHYTRVYDAWDKAGMPVPPVFIVVCNNTATSKLVHDYIAGGFEYTDANGVGQVSQGRFELFSNYDEHRAPLARPRTLLVDSEQLESDEALDRDFHNAAADEIAAYKREVAQRHGSEAAKQVTDKDILREVMNTVGKPGRLGESVRCVVSVSMLTEGWDVNTVTHILGVRAFGTALLCEQVVGRALRRVDFDNLDDDGLLRPEYADILGIPFDFAAKPVVAPPAPPRETIRVQAVPERARARPELEIRFPRIEGYRIDFPQERLYAEFTEDSVYHLTPEKVGPGKTETAAIVGETNTLDLEHLREERYSTVQYRLTKHILETRFREPDEPPKMHLFADLKRIVRRWMDTYLQCSGGTVPAQLYYAEIAEQAAERIYQACQRAEDGEKRWLAMPDTFNPVGSTATIGFTTSKETRWETRADRCHVNYVICDSDWEAEFARVAEAHPRVIAYVKNQGLGFEVPYRDGDQPRRYTPDFILKIDDGGSGPLHLVVEVKGFRRGNAQLKAETMRNQWVPGVNNLGTHGRWAFAEFTEVFEMEEAFDRLVREMAGFA